MSHASNRRHIKSTLLKCALISYVAYNDVGSNNNLIFVHYPFLYITSGPPSMMKDLPITTRILIGEHEEIHYSFSTIALYVFLKSFCIL